MNKTRLEAFSDGVIAILITIMVLELKVPHGDTVEALRPLVPVVLSYVLSFVYLGIYWNNHHHLLHGARRLTAGMMWANLHLLFWLSTIPFTTAWMGENHFAAAPTALYGASLLMSSIAWYVMQTAIIRHQGDRSALRSAIGRDTKGKISPLIYLAGIGLAFVSTTASDLLYLGAALMWLVPDRRVETTVRRSGTPRD